MSGQHKPLSTSPSPTATTSEIVDALTFVTKTASTDKLVAHAEALFNSWHRDLREERNRRLRELHHQRLSAGGRAVYRHELYKELLTREVRKRIEIYRMVAHEYKHPEMLSESRMDDFREEILRSLAIACIVLKDHDQGDANAVGDVSNLPEPGRYTILEATITDVMNAELAVLETKGAIEAELKSAVIPPAGPDAGKSSSAIKSKSDRVRREPHPNPVELLGNRAVQTFRTASEVTGLSSRTLRQLIEEGKLDASGKGAARRITTNSLRTYLKLPPKNLEERGKTRQ